MDQWLMILICARKINKKKYKFKKENRLYN